MPNDNADVKLLDGKVKIQGNTFVDGNMQVNGLLTAKLRMLEGWEFLGAPPSIHLEAADIVLHDKQLNEKKRNVALSHVDGDRLIINRGNGYAGGVEVEGIFSVKEEMTVGRPLWTLPQSKSPYVRIDSDTIKVHNVKVETYGSIGHGLPSITATQYIDVDLVHEILELKREVASLKAKLKTLEALES